MRRQADQNRYIQLYSAEGRGLPRNGGKIDPEWSPNGARI